MPAERSVKSIMESLASYIYLITKITTQLEYLCQQQSIPSCQATLACLRPDRLLHKMVVLLRWMARVVDQDWLRREFVTRVSVESDALGLLPEPRPADTTMVCVLASMQHRDSATGVCTLIPLWGSEPASFSPFRFGCLMQTLPTCSGVQALDSAASRNLVMFTHGSELVLEPGLLIEHLAEGDWTLMRAVTGWTGDSSTAFTTSPLTARYQGTQQLQRS